MSQRTMGLAGATGVGVGAIVGGGILALAGVAYSVTGPGAVVAFALNGLIAVATALSFAEMAAAFPESGGTYTFAKKVLNVRVAFGIGWVVWFASLVAAVLYALGFGAFAMIAVREVVGRLAGEAPAWLASRWCVTGLGLLATGGFTLGLTKRSAGGGMWINVTKTLVFLVVIAGGLWALTRTAPAEATARLSPFFPGGASGLFQAMGFTFIALQGFDLIAAVAGEVKEPGRNLPRAMLGSLGIALAIYLPLLLVVAIVGVGPGEKIADLARREPEAVVAIATRRFFGDFGYWLVVGAGVLSMLSALQANLFAASRVAYAMGRDRTLSAAIGDLDERNIPRRAVLVVAGVVSVTLVVVPDVATAGAASSLIFLITFALAHFISILVRNRLDASELPFRVPLFPLVPIAGGAACMGLAFFQGASVPLAGAIAVMWLTVGVGLYAFRFAGRAQSFDALAEGIDPQLVKYRGRSPLVLVPVDDETNAVSLVAVADALTPTRVGRVLLASQVPPPKTWKFGELPRELAERSRVLSQSINESFARGLEPEAIITVADNHWNEVRRIAGAHQCESLLLGFRNIRDQAREAGFNELVTDLPCDIVLLRMPKGWRFLKTRRVLIPLGGRGMHSPLRARLLGSLRRQVEEVEATYVCFLGPSATRVEYREAHHVVRMRASDEMGGRAQTAVERCEDPAEEVIRHGESHDLIILGLQQSHDLRRGISDFTLRIADRTSCALMVIGQRRDDRATKLADRVMPGFFRAG